MLTSATVSWLITFAAALLLTPFVIRRAAAWRLFDVPTDGRRVHTEPIPRLGGVGIFLATAAGAVAWMVQGGGPLQPSPLFLALACGGALAFAAGLWDDLAGLSPIAKFAAQCVAALIAVGFGIRFETIHLGSFLHLEVGSLAVPLTVLWIVGVTNAFNLIDGLDGLATGVAMVTLGATAFAAQMLGVGDAVVFSLILVGALLGFLRYNFSPALIFLGDSGSLFVGFALALLTVAGSTRADGATVIVVPLFALALPLVDTGLAMLRRWLRGVPLSGADARHIHHQLLGLGFSQRRSAVILYALALGLAGLGLALAFSPPAVVVGMAFAGGGLTVLLFLYGMRQLGYHEFAEAAMVIITGVPRVRRVIRDQINARDLAHAIERAADLDQIDAILGANARRLGFLDMEVCREMSPGRCRAGFVQGESASAWRLEYPVTPQFAQDANPFVLRILCGLGDAHRPYGAERVARILAPAVEQWLVKAWFGVPAGAAATPAAAEIEWRMNAADSGMLARAKGVAGR